MSTFWKSVGSVLTGTAIAQIIPVAGTLIIARQYEPDQFGVFSVWLGLVLLLGVVLTGRFEAALAIEHDGEPRRLGLLSTVATACLGAAVALLICLIVMTVAPEISRGLPVSLVAILVPAAFAIALAQTWQSWAAAEGRYRHLSFMRIVQAAAVTLVQILVGCFSPTAFGLASAYLIGLGIGLVLSMFLMPPGRFPRHMAIKSISSFWQRHRRLPTFSLPADTINTAAAQLPVLLVAGRFGGEVAGLLAMAMRMLGAPIGLLGKSVLDVFKRHAATSYRERGECRADYVRTFRVLSAASLLFGVVLFFTAEPLFALAFGEKWREAGTIAVWLIPMFAFKFMASPLSYMVYIAAKQHVDLVWQVALLAMTFTALTVPVGHEAALQGYSVGYSLLYVIYLMMSYRFSLGAKK